MILSPLVETEWWKDDTPEVIQGRGKSRCLDRYENPWSYLEEGPDNPFLGQDSS